MQKKKEVHIFRSMKVVPVGGFRFIPPFLMALPTEYVPGYNVQCEIDEHGHWAFEETYILVTILRHYSTVQQNTLLDIGANTGYFSLLALALGQKVVAIEPNQVHNPFWYHSIQVNNFNPSDTQWHNDFVGTGDQVMFDGWTGCPALQNPAAVTCIQSKPVIEFVPEGCLFAKIDVEGVEPNVLESATPLLRKGQIPFIMFEMTFIIKGVIDERQFHMLHQLQQFQYSIYEICPLRLVLIRDVDGYKSETERKFPNVDVAGTNLLAVHYSQLPGIPFEKLPNGDFSLPAK